MKSWVSTWLTPSLVIGGIVAGAWFGGQYKTDANTRMFESPEQRNDVINRYTEYPNDYDLYKLMIRNEKLDKKLDTSFAVSTAIFKNDIARQKLDSANKVHTMLSRASRDSVVKKQAAAIQDIRREQRNTSNAIQLILQKLDTTQ